MAHKFTDDEKTVKEYSDQNWFKFGVHKVTIGEIAFNATENGKEFIEITVLGENGEEDTARVWFTSPKAANFSFNVLRAIYVHNAPEEAKDAARDTMDAVSDAEELAHVLNEKLIGKECWFSKYPDPNRTYTDQQGNIKQSVNKNVYGYEPKLRPELMPQGESAKASVLDGAEDVANDKEVASGIPSSW